MAVLKTDKQEVELPDGSRIKDASVTLGVMFGCEVGICGTCCVEILEGEENLDELNEQEVAMGNRDRKHRLACQCSILKGSVKIKNEHE